MMRFRKLALAVGAMVFLPHCSAAIDTKTHASPVLRAEGCAELLDFDRSTFVMHVVRSGTTKVCNADRAGKRFTPASTFKIAHALIALEAGVVADENAAFRWDGTSRGVKAWDRDTNLAEAIANSTVWVFQEIASQLGHAQEQAAVERLDYGNEDIGGPFRLRQFWLLGPLAISAFEQVEFLTQLRAGSLSADRTSQSRTVAMLRMRGCGEGCAVYGKTGAVLPIDEKGILRSGEEALLPEGMERTGWFVGWIERPESLGGPVVFAHNLNLSLPGAMAARTSVAFKILDANGIPTTDR